jgi:hypothetical protein
MDSNIKKGALVVCTYRNAPIFGVVMNKFTPLRNEPTIYCPFAEAQESTWESDRVKLLLAPEGEQE